MLKLEKEDKKALEMAVKAGYTLVTRGVNGNIWFSKEERSLGYSTKLKRMFKFIENGKTYKISDLLEE